MTNAAEVTLWPSLSIRNSTEVVAFLTAIGLTEHASYPHESDPAQIMHAEWLWPAGGGIMLGSATTQDQLARSGTAAIYLICTDPDAVFERAVAAGGTVVREMVDQDYGGRGGTVADADGNQWSFGNYQPA